MQILCCCLSFCFVILRETIYQCLKPKRLNKKLQAPHFFSSDSFTNNKINSNLSKEKLKDLHNLRKQKHSIIQKVDKSITAVLILFLSNFVLTLEENKYKNSKIPDYKITARYLLIHLKLSCRMSLFNQQQVQKKRENLAFYNQKHL